MSGLDCSAEVWTLSGSSESNTGTPISRDSGHSSSIISFEKANISELNGSNTHSDPDSSKSSLISGPPLHHSTSDSTPSSISPVTSMNYTSSYNTSDSLRGFSGKNIIEEVVTSSNISYNKCEAVNQNNGTSSKLGGKIGSFDTNIVSVHINTGSDTTKSTGKIDSKSPKVHQIGESKQETTTKPAGQKCVPNERRNNVINPFKPKTNTDFRFIQNPKKHISTNSYQNERNLSPSERILHRSAANKLNKEPDSKQNNSNHVHLPNRITVDIKNGESVAADTVEESSTNKKGLRLEIGESGIDKADNDMSDTSEPPSPAICFFKIGENGTKSPNTDQNKNTLVNGLGTNKVLVPGEISDHGGGDGHRFHVASNLSKIRENHLAKRRDNIRHSKMPQLSELSEKDSPENNNEEKHIVAPLINMKAVSAHPVEANGDVIMPNIPDEFLQKLDLTPDGTSSEELSDQEIESKFTSLSLAFKTDSQTLEKRLEIQERSRDIAEQNVDKELQGLRSCLETLNQICTDPQVREVLTKIQNHVDILEKSTARVSSRAEVFGAIQQEKRMSKAVDIMVHHVENIRRVHEREHAELEEARKLLQDSRSLAPSTIDLGGGDMRRSVSVCQNNMFGGKATRRRVSEIALPKVLGGTGAATLHPSASMDSFYIEPRSPRASVPSLYRTESYLEEEEGNMHTAHIDSDSNSLRPNFEADARSRFQAVIASTTVKSAVANTLRRASLEKQNHVQSVSPGITPQVSRNNSSESANKLSESQDKEKQKNLEEEAFKKGYEQGMRASIGQDLSSLREQQNNINESLGEVMDSIDNQMEEPKSLKEMLVERFHETVPKIKISGWRIRMTMGCFFVAMAILSVIVSLFPVGSASLVGYRHYGRPPL